MTSIFTGILNWLRGLFFAKHLEVTIVGLQVRGSSTSCSRHMADKLLLISITQASGKTR
jgi:ADP-ribosylation factor-like protein 8